MLLLFTLKNKYMKKLITLLVLSIFLFSCVEKKNPRYYTGKDGQKKMSKVIEDDKTKNSTNKKNKKKKGCGDSDSTNFYWDEYLVLIDKEQLMDESNKVKIFLLHRLTDSTKYVELTTYDFSTRIKHSHNDNKHYVDSLYYSTNIGDKLYFKFIDKNRFFKVKK